MVRSKRPSTVTIRQTRGGFSVKSSGPNAPDLRDVMPGLFPGLATKPPTRVQLQRAYDAARAAELKAVAAVPETPPRHEPTPRAKAAAERAWKAADKTNAARAALTAAIDRGES